MAEIIFRNLGEMQPYFDEETNTYEFVKRGRYLDIEITFALDVKSNIRAGHVHALDIKALNIEARDIFAEDVEAKTLEVRSIKAENIKAQDIEFWDLCITEGSIYCNSIQGRHFNSLYYCIDGGLHIDGKYYQTEGSKINR
jgi:hypothetical protein